MRFRRLQFVFPRYNAQRFVFYVCLVALFNRWRNVLGKEKGKEEYLYSAIHSTHTLKALRHGSHSFTCKLLHACLSFVSVHRTALPLTEVADIQCSLLLIYRPRRDEKLSWPGWLTYSRQFTHISGIPSATRREEDRESSPAKDRRSIAVPCTQPTSSILITFRMSRRRREMYIGHARLSVCLSVCLSLAAFPHYFTDPDVTWENGSGAP